jgi:hypothetical protein
MPRYAPFGYQRFPLSFYVLLPTGTGAAEIVTDWTAGFNFVVEAVSYYTAVAGTGTSASRTFRVLKGASTVVATATLALADTSDLGEAKAFTVTAADAEFSDTDTLTVDFASGGTAFTAGAGNLVIRCRALPQRKA